MKTILYIPLDERPCNYDYPMRLFQNISEDVNTITIPKELLGYKKQAANITKIKEYIESNISTINILIYSSEMLAYGGLLPSRIHALTTGIVEKYVSFTKRLKRLNPSIEILASNLIMRTPRYNSGDEEPDYYETYGERISRLGWLKDKRSRESLTQNEEKQLSQLQSEIPDEIINDYESRRKQNVALNQANIYLVDAGVIDSLVIPQDDSAPYGYTAMDQKQVYGLIKRMNLQDKIFVYPGADEVGYTLLSRAIQIIRNKQLKVFPIFSGSVGKTIIPLYEDRPLIESLKSHISSAGCMIADHSSDADIVLAVNVPGLKMQEAWDQIDNHEITYDTYRNLRVFVRSIEHYLNCGKKVAIADCAYANGGDIEFIRMLDKKDLIIKLLSYRGWNTNGNTLGSSIATAVIHYFADEQRIISEIISSILDDGFYQAIIRKKITNQLLPSLGLSYFDLKNKADRVTKTTEKEINDMANRYLTTTLARETIKKLSIYFPWNRMFEINCQAVL